MNTTEMIPEILSLIAGIGCYAIRELYYHGKLRWQNDKKPLGFWGKKSDLRKYKLPTEPPKDNWYYRINDLTYKELFPLSGTLFVAISDGPHFFQWLQFNFLALSMTFALGFNWFLLLGLLIGIRFINWLSRKLFIK